MANVEKLEAVLDHIKMNREQHDQRYWGVQAECGTTMCFAGWAVTLEGYDLEWSAFTGSLGYDTLPDAIQSGLLERLAGEGIPRTVKATGAASVCTAPNGNHWPVAAIAQELLGLSPEQSDRLFYRSITFDEVERTVKDIINEQTP